MIDGFRDISGGLAIQKPSDWRGVGYPRADSPFISGQLERINRVIEAVGAEVPVFYHSFSPFSSMRINWGDDVVFAHFRDREARPDFLYALGELTKRFEEYIGIFLSKTQAAGMMLTLTGTERNGIGGAEHAECIAPSDKALIRAAGRLSRYTMLHMCGFGGRPNRLELWKDYEAAAATVDVYEDAVSLEEAPSLFPRIRAFMGGFDISPQSLIMTGTEDEIKAHARSCVRQAGKTGYILGAANTAPRELSHRRIRWVGEALPGLPDAGS
jgi:uroporphyrinogen decarboxylase